jgi:hypothetical protein
MNRKVKMSADVDDKEFKILSVTFILICSNATYDRNSIVLLQRDRDKYFDK